MDRVTDGFGFAAKQINRVFGNREPWQIAAITAGTVLTSVWLWDILSEDECLCSRAKKRIFKLSRNIPSIRNRVDAELKKLKDGFEKDVQSLTNGMEYYLTLPYHGKESDDLLKEIDGNLELGKYEWKNGKVSGAVYNFNEKILELVKDVYGKTSYTNPLHSDIFPGICKMEAEVVRMTAMLFKGDPSKSCGTMTTGGTESIMMACKAYRDYGRDIKGIRKPNIVMPKSAHTAFDKAAQYLGIYTKYVPLNCKTYEVNLKEMEAAINKNTIMLVGSAPNYPYGTMDDIEGIAELGKKYNIPVHVDACLGGFLIVFMRRAGYVLRPFDFSVDGVTSISADTHKYGYTPKGSSLILYSDEKYRRYQYTVTTDWPGGVYGSPTVNGSRAGGNIAVTWATMLSYGEDGYVEATKQVIDTSRYIENGLRKIHGIFIFGTPATSVIAIGSKDFDIYRLSDELNKVGWNLNTLQFPSGIHICVTYMHTEVVADKFLADVKAKVAELMINPEEPVQGKMALYGVAQTVPDRSIVAEFTKSYIDSTYFIPHK